MGVELQRGENIVVPESDIMVGIDWDICVDWDVDVSAFLVGASGKVRNDYDFVFYNQPRTPCGSISIDKEFGKTQECFRVSVDKIPQDVSKVIFCLSTGHGVELDNSTHCGMIGRIRTTVMAFSGDDLFYFNLSSDHQERALMIGNLYRHQGFWKFKVVGQGYKGGLDVLAGSLGVEIGDRHDDDSNTADVDEEIKNDAWQTVSLYRRRSPRQVWEEKSSSLRQSLKKFIPQIKAAAENQINESNTRMILDKMLMDVFGYSMDEVKAEQVVQGRKADYVLSLGDQDMIVCETKRAGTQLRDRHVFQATSYGAYSGIRWALLTNLVTWRVYHISAQDVVNSTLVFSVDLLPDVDQENCELLMLISRYGMTRKGMLERRKNEVSALTRESMVRAIMTEDVINKIRLVIKKETGCSFENDLIRHALEETLINQ